VGGALPEDIRAEQAILADATQRKENRHQSHLERRLDKAQRSAFILAQLENPRIPPMTQLERLAVVGADVILNRGLLRLPLGLRLVGATGVIILERLSRKKLDNFCEMEGAVVLIIAFYLMFVFIV
jgi:hypothetical protein